MSGEAFFARDLTINTSPHYRHDLDGLRAIAVLSVLLFHAFPRTIRGGFGGVDVFFVLSGFLIGGILYRQAEAGTFSLTAFYARRARRLFPALATVLIAGLGLGLVLLLPGELQRFGQHLAAGVFFVENVILQGESGYFDTASESKPFLHLWSLAIEEQFYLFFPFVVLGLRKSNVLRAFVIAMLLIASLGLCFVETSASERFFLPQFRAWELLSGALLASFQRAQGKSCARVMQHIEGGLGLSLVIAALFALRPSQGAFDPWLLLLVSGTLLVLDAGPKSSVNRVLLSHRGLVGIGLISYPLYLWHWLLLAFLHLSVTAPSSALKIACLIASFPLAFWTTYRIEAPIRFGEPHRVSSGQLIGLMVALGLIGLLIQHGAGFPQRFDDPRQKSFGLEHRPKERAACPPPFEALQFCGPKGPETPHTALIGDSHSLHLVKGLVVAGVSFIHYGRHSCPPFFDTGFGTGDTGCRPGTLNEALKAVLSNPQIQNVILAGRFGVYWHGNSPIEHQGPRGIDFPLTGPGEKSNQSRFIDAARRTVDPLLAAGKRVLLVIDVPELGFDPRTCVHPLEALRRAPEACGIPRQRYEARRKAYLEIFMALKATHPDLVLVDPITLFCDNDRCSASSPQSLLYLDDDHLSNAGSIRLGKVLGSALDASVDTLP